jgi:CheY-like chemotaxis protein
MNKISLLVVEDNPADAALVREFLAGAVGSVYELETVETLSEALSFLSKRIVDVVLLDLSLPDSTGVETVRTVTGKFPRVAIIVLTGLEDEAVALQAVRYGAQDYLGKRNLSATMLQRAISYSLERKKALREKEILLADLSLALERIEMLQGMLPVCPSCKKIHADDNRWYQAEEYFKTRGGCAAGQSVCPDCLQELHGSKFS